MPIYKRIIVLLNILRLIPHLVFYLVKRNECVDDVMRAINHHNYTCSELFSVCYLLTFDKTFRNLFYWRIGKIKYFIKFLLPPESSFDIATYSKIDKGFLCVHPIATFVNAESIGKNFSVKNSITIGNSTTGRPIIGDNVEINANSVVVGKIHIGNNVIIGAGTVLTKSVPDNCVVIGNPAFILKQNGVRVNKKL